MPEPKRPLKVFLCHAHADRDPVRGLYTRLTQDGVDAWLDKAKLLPGQDWELEIRKAVREADVVVVCLSKQFNQAGFRQKEVRLALDTAMEKPEGEIFIIPARLEECDNLESLRRWHEVDLFEEDGYEMLMRALRARANKIGATLQVKREDRKLSQNTEDEKIKKEAKIKALQRQAEHFEQKLDFSKALESYYEIEKIDPFFLGLDQKLTELENKRDNENELIAMINDGLEKHQATPKSSIIESFPKRIFNVTSFMSVMAVLFCVASVTLIPLLGSLIKKIESTPTPTPQIKLTNTAQVINSPFLTLTVNKIPTLTSSPIITATPLPTEITDVNGVSMVLVPAGEFTMGSNASYKAEKPVHLVYLDSYYIDKYEVSNDLYRDCVSANVCTPPRKVSSNTRLDYYNNSDYDNYPVVNVDWSQSNIYCEWHDAKLPTEAQWEKAARGTDGRTYPWGEGIDCSKANYWGGANGCVGNTTEVGSYEGGKSLYGVYDMAGNVYEWVNDWYSETYYQNSPYSNPIGPETGSRRTIRGGTWYDFESILGLGVRTFVRTSSEPSSIDIGKGFRCSRSP